MNYKEYTFEQFQEEIKEMKTSEYLIDNSIEDLKLITKKEFLSCLNFLEESREYREGVEKEDIGRDEKNILIIKYTKRLIEKLDKENIRRQLIVLKIFLKEKEEKGK